MLKFVVYFVIAAVVVIAAASVWHLMRVAAGNKEEMLRYAGPEKEFTGHFGKALVVYYSLDGHTREIAEKIREKTGADIYEIKTREKFKNTPWFYLTLKKQLKNGEYPELAGELPDPKAYDVVFVGAPVWWYTMATPLFSYLKQTDFGGRIVVPFSTQGSNSGSFFADFVKEAKNAEVDTAAAFNNLPEGYEREVDNKIVSWLNGLSRQ